MNFETVIEKLRNNEPFHLSRWGDGEFLCMLGAKGKNCDGHNYSNGLAAELVWAFNGKPKNKNVYDLVQNHALRTVEGIEVLIKGKQYDSADLFVKASQNGELGKLFAALKDKHIIFVAPKRFEDWDLFKVSKHIVIPETNCFNSYMAICDTLQDAINDTACIDENLVVLYCAGMMSNVLISDNSWYSNNNFSQIDLGSVLEPYIGHSNRKYHTEIIQKLKS
jgi:hypothetical protein